MSFLVPHVVAALACLAVGCAGRPGTPPQSSAASPQAADTTGMTRIRFARGTTSGILDDSLPAGGERVYLLGAERGQVMLAHAIAWNDPGNGRRGEAVVRVYRADGAELVAPRGAGALWSGRLPYTGDYVVRVRALDAPATYTLAVQIPRRLGATASFSGTAPSRAPVDFLVPAGAGTTLEAELRSEDGAHLHVYGLDDGVQLARLADRKERWVGRLPSSQDYVVSVVPAGEGTGYDLRVTVR